MSLWIDKHRPQELKQLDYHKDQAEHISKLVEGGDFPHLLVYGPSGAGKKVGVKVFDVIFGKITILFWYHIKRRMENQKFKWDWVYVQKI